MPLISDEMLLSSIEGNFEKKQPAKKRRVWKGGRVVKKDLKNFVPQLKRQVDNLFQLIKNFAESTPI